VGVSGGVTTSTSGYGEGEGVMGKGDSAMKICVRVFDSGQEKTTNGGNRVESLWRRGKGGNHWWKAL